MKKLPAIALCLAMLLMGVSAFAEDAGTINIALIANTTGDYAQYGIPVRNGAMLYIDQLNAAGGINGKQIQVFEYDDKADGIETVNAFNLALENNISAVIGSVLTGATIALSDATYEVNVPQITASATAAGVTVIDPEDPESEVRTNVFRSCFIDPFQGEKMADYAVNKMGAKTAAVLFETGSDYSEGLKDAFVAKAEELGLEIVATEAFATGDRQLIEQIRQPDIFHCVQISAGSRTESAGNIRFSSACGAHEDHIALVQDVPASTQLLQEIPVELSVRAVLNILYTGIGKI